MESGNRPSQDGLAAGLRAAGAGSDSSGVYICKSVVNYIRHENFICKSEDFHLRAAGQFLEGARGHRHGPS